MRQPRADEPLRLETADGARLDVVPSVHFRLPFAIEVNHRAAEWRPDAIAVELGPETAGATHEFLTGDLGMGSDHRTRCQLPCMLGLIRENRRLHPSTRDAAIRLQRRTHLPLGKQSLETLREELGYSSFSVLYLSCTDSIVEAARCAVELRVPLYGVDADNMASARRPEIILQDPLDSIENRQGLVDYVNRNAVLAEAQRDEEVDDRRERIMAARLKLLLQRHRRVLFVCGLAHWNRLRQLLLDESTPVAAHLAKAEELRPRNFRKVLVHPTLAVSHLDTFPCFASGYERDRKHAAHPNHGCFQVRVWDEINTILRVVCEQHFVKSRWRELLGQLLHRWERTGNKEKLVLEARALFDHAPREEICEADALLGSAEAMDGKVRHALDSLARPSDQLARTLEDWEALPSFQQLLANLTLLRRKSVPDLHTILSAAQGVMSEEFRLRLAERLMSLGRGESRRSTEGTDEHRRQDEWSCVEWASHECFPDYAILAPAPSSGTRWQRARLVSRRGEESGVFYIESEPGHAGLSVQVPVPWNWDQEPKKELSREEVEDLDHNSISSWLPVDNLLSVFCLRAFKLSREQARGLRIEEFGGALHDGLAIKPTLRNLARGKNRLCVWIRPRELRKERPDDDEAGSFPIVWIPKPYGENLGWGDSKDSIESLVAATRAAVARAQAMPPGSPDQAKMVGLWQATASWLVDVSGGRGHFVSAVYAKGADTRIDALCRPGYEVYGHEHLAELRFNPVPGVLRTAEWIHRTRRAPGAKILFSCPLLQGPNLERHFASHHGFRLSDYAWPVALVLMAIPYALHSVTIVAPDGYAFPKVVRDQASRLGKELRFVPLSYFPADGVRRVTNYVMCPTLGRTPDEQDLPIYPEHVRSHFNEPLHRYRNLIPRSWH